MAQHEAHFLARSKHGLARRTWPCLGRSLSPAGGMARHGKYIGPGVGPLPSCIPSYFHCNPNYFHPTSGNRISSPRLFCIPTPHFPHSHPVTPRVFPHPYPQCRTRLARTRVAVTTSPPLVPPPRLQHACTTDSGRPHPPSPSLPRIRTASVGL